MIRQFDVFNNPVRAGREERPFVICVQHRSFDALQTRIVVPLITAGAIGTHSRAAPTFDVHGRRVTLSPAELFPLSTTYLRSALANLEAERDRIIAALDLVFTGI